MGFEKVILEKIKPDMNEEILVKEFVTNLIRTSKAITGLDSVVCGSIGKFTWLSGDHDIDLFILFPDVTREELESKGLEYGKAIAKELGGKPLIKYAEHPYVRTVIEGFEVDIVPCYRIKKGEKIKSAVDRSVLHLEYVLTHLTATEKDEVRLLKQFCKGIGVYGSDVKHCGFSGYICELLVINYKTFRTVLEAATKWAAPQVIGEGVKPKIDFPDQPLIIIDPVDEKRNAAANVNAQNFELFVKKSAELLKRPSLKFFLKEKERALTATQTKLLRKRETNIIIIKFLKPDVIDDIFYPKFRKSLKRIESILEREDFRVLRGLEFADEKNAYLILEMVVWSLPAIKKMTGPPIFSKQHSLEFLSKYKKVYIEENKWIGERKRSYREAVQVLKTIKDVEFLSKYSIKEGNEAINEILKNKKLSDFIRREYF